MIANPVPCGFATCRRCGARCKRTGLPCKQPAMPNGRCKLHGGKSPGAPTGERHGQYKHGRRTKAAMAERKAVTATLKELKRLIKTAGGK